MMIRTSLPAVLLAAAIAVAAAADIDGRWKAEFSTPDGQTAHNTFTFKTEGEKVTGTVFSSFSGSEAKIEDGAIKGEALTFSILRDFGGTEVRLRYAGKVSGNEIQFTVTAGEGAEGFQLEMTAKRDKP